MNFSQRGGCFNGSARSVWDDCGDYAGDAGGRVVDVDGMDILTVGEVATGKIRKDCFMPKPLDGKFYGVVVRHKDNQIEPPDGWMVFVARDNALPDTLKFYKGKCIELGAGHEQIAAIDVLISRVAEWRTKNPDKLKVPDVQIGELSW